MIYKFTRDPPIDWPQIFVDLREVGCEFSDICIALNITRQHIYAWQKGSEPLYEMGRAILKLHSLAMVDKYFVPKDTETNPTSGND